MSFVRGSNPIWFFSNLTGQPFDDTYYAFFLTNDLPYIPKTVYQNPNGSISWSNPIEFQPSSGLPNNIYGDPDVPYRLEFRKGPTQNDPLIDLVENYFFSGSGNSTEEIFDALLASENMITNPNFSDINFVSPLLINVAGTYDIAPGWKLVITGSGGNTTITQVPNAGSSNIIGNPTYFIMFNNSGWTSVQLIQTFSNNGAIFTGGAIAIALTAYSSGSSNVLTVSYHPSGASGVPIFNVPIPTGSPLPYKNAVNLLPSTNSDTGLSAFVNIEFALPATGSISLSNIQITGQSVPLSSGFNPTEDSPLFQESTYERILDNEYHIYSNSLLTQAKNNILTGWTFALNPWQFRTKSQSNLANNAYTADQTIVAQQAYVTSATPNNISVGQGSNAQNNGFLVNSVTANNQFALIEYIDPSIVKPYWGQILSSMVNARINTINSTLCKFKMKLIWRTSLPSTIGQNEPIASWTALGEPVFSVGWTSVSCLNDLSYTFGTTDQNFSFNKFQLPSSSTSTMTLAIVIYTTTNLNISGTPDSILFNRISLVHNDYAIDASPETYDESFRKCQFYYEQSYIDFASVGTNTNNGIRYTPASLYTSVISPAANQGALYATEIQGNYKELKRANPILTLYAMNGTINSLTADVYSGTSYPTPSAGTNPTTILLSSFYSVISNTVNGFLIHPVINTSILNFVTPNVFENSSYGELFYHYTADSRLGI